MAFENSTRLIADLLDTCSLIAQNYRNELTNQNHVASGQLSRFDYKVEYTNDMFTLLYILPLYWYYIEQGRKPTVNGQGGVLYPAILKWIGEKNIVPRAGKNGIVPTREGLAHMITKSIHKKGYPANHTLRTAMEKSRPLIEEMKREIAELMVDEIRIDIATLGKM